MSNPKISDVIATLKTKDLKQECQFLVVSPIGAVIAAHLTSDLVDMEKLFKCFKNPRSK